MSWSYQLSRWLWGSLDWIFPPLCGGCERVGFRWCPECQQQVSCVSEPVCEICGLPLSRQGLCSACRLSRPPHKSLRSWVVFEGPIRNALHKLEYRRNIGLGDALAQYLAGYLASLAWPVEMVVPVPLSRKRYQERGYNQVALLARPLAASLGLRYAPITLVRVRETQSQVGLSAAERKENVTGAFNAEPALANGKVVLIMDDVATTGATLASCAQELMIAGAISVYALTLARALPQHGLQKV